jgi:hypothetical protein
MFLGVFNSGLAAVLGPLFVEPQPAKSAADAQLNSAVRKKFVIIYTSLSISFVGFGSCDLPIANVNLSASTTKIFA